MSTQDTVTCIICDRSFATGNRDQYQPLKYFDDCCICVECLNRTKTGYPRPSHKATAGN